MPKREIFGAEFAIVKKFVANTQHAVHFSWQALSLFRSRLKFRDG
jgi:hypothetical protein